MTGGAGYRSKVLRWALVAVVVLAVGCLGTLGWSVIRMVDSARSAADGSGTAVVDPGLAEPTPRPTLDRPQPSSYAVREQDDLKRVCDGWYYPKSPKAATKGLNPLVAYLSDRKDSPSLVHKNVNGVPYRSSKAVRDAYDPGVAAKVRLVACLNLTDTGKHLRTCKFSDSKPDTVALEQGFYSFTVYEVATGRTLVHKKITGADDGCPFVVLVGSDHMIHSTVGDRQLYELLRRYVQK